MTRAFFHPAAQRELQEAVDRYNAEEQRLGTEFREEVQRVLELLGRFPRLGQSVRGSIRRAVLFSLSLPSLLPAPGLRGTSAFWRWRTIVASLSIGSAGNSAAAQRRVSATKERRERKRA
jgi:plasmid stabilization system protein ParE